MKEVVVLWFLLQPHHSEDVHLFAKQVASMEACKEEGQKVYQAVQHAADVGRLDGFHGECSTMTEDEFKDVMAQVDVSEEDILRFGSE